jgi:filamin
VGKLAETSLLNEEATFTLTEVQNLSELHIKVRSQTGREDITPKLVKGASSSFDYTVKWTPRELGTYTLAVTYMDKPVKDTPMRVKIFDPKLVKVTNVTEAVLGKPTTFLVDASEAGEGSLEIGITCAGHFIPNQVMPLGHSKFEVQFVAHSAAAHLASVSFNGLSVTGSPYTVRVADPALLTVSGKALLGLIPVNVNTSFQVATSALAATSHHVSVSQLHCTATNAKGESIPVRVSVQPSGDFTGQFTPTCIGTCRVEVTYSGQCVAGSPFTANVFDPHGCEIRNMPRELIVSAESSFEADMTRVGNVEFAAKVISPAGVSLPVTYEGKEGGKKRVSFVPNELGPHKLALQIAGQNIAGTPLILNAVEPRFPVASGEGLHRGIENKPAYFFIDPQGMKGGTIECNIEGPHHYTKNQMERQADGTYLVKYMPLECGIFKIHIKWNQRDAPGSPHLAYIVNPDKVRVIGGWHTILDRHNVLNLKYLEERSISFDVSDAGPGTLTALITAPNGSKMVIVFF